jgi:hypothetical protein
VTNTSVSTDALAMASHGAMAVASSPTRKGPTMNTVSSAADS